MEHPPMEPATTLFDDNCEQLHLWDLHEHVQEVFTRLTGEGTDWMKCRTEPWWSLGMLFHG